MALSSKERKELYDSTIERLAGVIGASGKPEELVRLTTQIVQAAKKLSLGTPEDIKTRSTTTLAEFVLAAKKIAQDVRAVDSTSLQRLSTTKRSVEIVVKELDRWHSSHSSKDEADISLSEILTQTSSGVNRTDSRNSGNSVGSRGSRISPTELGPVSELERKLTVELKKQHEVLLKKTDPQSNPRQNGQPEDILKTAVGGLSRSSSQLVELAGQKNPSKEGLLEPTILLAKMVSMLMDLVDSLFVSKYPMRTQVHSFSCMLIDNALSYGDQSKTEDAASLRLICTQAPALMSALEVMVEQCYKRSANISESRKFSIQRNVDLHDLDVYGPGHSPRNSPVVKRRKDPPVPPNKKVPVAPQKLAEFEICCMICSSVAIDTTTNSMMNKGTEIMLKVNEKTSVLDVRKILKARTNLPLNDIQIRFRGDDVLSDDTRVTRDNPMPYFIFNLNEPGEEELVEIKREQRRKNRMKIDDADWSRVPSPVAVAIYDYEALAEPGEDDNLEFDEGDLIQIVEKSADGWWTGKVDGKVGVFPASFVEEIQIPKTKEERKKLVKRFHQGRLGGDNPSNDVITFDEVEEAPAPPKNSVFQSSVSEPGNTGHGLLGLKNKVFRRQQNSSTSSDTSDHSGGRSPSPTKKVAPLSKRNSEPSFAQFEQKEKEGKQKKRISLFKKKHHNTSSSNYQPIAEGSSVRSPIFKQKDISPPISIPELDQEISAAGGATRNQQLLQQQPKALYRPKSSPRLNTRGLSGPERPKPPSAEAKVHSSLTRSSSGGASAGTGERKVRRRPPPPPPPYAKRHGSRGMKELLERRASEEVDSGESAEGVSPVPPLSASVTSRKESFSPPIVMQVTPASPPPSSSTSPAQDEEEEEDLPPIKSSHSMEELFKNLEEFDEFSSTQSLTNGFHHKSQNGEKSERDYATIPRSELPVRFEEDDDDDEEESEEPEERPSSVPISSSQPSSLSVLEPRVCLTPTPLSGKTDPLVSSSPPKKPPRRHSKRAIAAKQLEQEKEQAQEPETQTPSLEVAKTKPKPPPKPVENGLKDEQVIATQESESPNLQPKAPPRKKSLKRMSQASAKAELEKEKQKEEEEQKRMTQQNTPSVIVVEKGKLSPNLGRPIPPPKPKPSKKPIVPGWKTHLDAMDRPVCASAPVSRTASPDDAGVMSASVRLGRGASTEVLNPTRSPVVMRRTRAVARSVEPEFSDDELEASTGIGKEGMLHKEGTHSSGEWKPRYFQLGENGIAYYDIGAHIDGANPLGVVMVDRMQGAVPLGEKNHFQCFAINMRYDTSVILGCHSKMDMDDWVKSINKVIKSFKSEATTAGNFTSSYKTALKCISYLSDGNRTEEDRVFIAAAAAPAIGNTGRMKIWLDAVDKGEDPDLSELPNAATAIRLLVSLFKPARLACPIKHDLAVELSSLTKSADPISDIATKLKKLSNECLGLLKQLFRLFSQVLDHSHKNHTELEDLNRIFGPILFENVTVAQSEKLLAYLVSTCELVIS